MAASALACEQTTQGDLAERMDVERHGCGGHLSQHATIAGFPALVGWDIDLSLASNERWLVRLRDCGSGNAHHSFGMTPVDALHRALHMVYGSDDYDDEWTILLVPHGDLFEVSQCGMPGNLLFERALRERPVKMTITGTRIASV